MEENKLAQEVASNLLKIKAVFLKPSDPFTWASGIKSPIYCDNRLTLSYPEVREVVEEGLVETIKKYYPEVEVIEGTSTAGIAHAAIVAEKMKLPMGYVRANAKDHGRGVQIEGVVPAGKKVSWASSPSSPITSRKVWISLPQANARTIPSPTSRPWYL